MSKRITGVFVLAAVAILARGEITSKTEKQLTPPSQFPGLVAAPDPSLMSQRCETEAAAYAAALIILQNAQADAAAAYHAWYDCEYGQQQSVTPSPAPGPEHSILIRD